MNKKKITWEVIFDDFKQRHPNLAKRINRYNSYGYATIQIYLDDGMKLIYNYDTKRATFC